MALTTTEQQQVTLGLSRYFSSRGIPISSIDEVALYQAVGTTSGVIDGVQATFYAALPAAVWDNMAAGEKALLFAITALMHRDAALVSRILGSLT